jgi:hypothetical protein
VGAECLQAKLFKEDDMQSRTFINNTLPCEYLIPADTSMQDLFLSSSGWVGLAVDRNWLKRDHPDLIFAGIVGFDVNKQGFVFGSC